MEILGIGPLELLFIILIALIVLGPNDMVKAGRTMGKFLRRIITSPGWRTFQQASRDIRYLPNKLMRDAGLEELEENLAQMKNLTGQNELQEVNRELKGWETEISSWTTPPPLINTPDDPLSGSSANVPNAEKKENNKEE
jgi:Sec-independent protein translocase protein TatA